MEDKTYRACQNCGAVNLNRDYCQNCGEIINTDLQRKLERERAQQAKERARPVKLKKKNKVTIFFENAREHESAIIRYPARFFYSIWVIVLAIGSFLAFLLAYIAA